MPGMGEWLIILVIVLIVFGASKLPQLGHGLGAAIKNFKKAQHDGDDAIEVSKKKELSSGNSAKAALEAGDDDDDEMEEVVVRRRKVKPASKSS